MIGPATANIQLFEQENTAARKAGARLGFEVTRYGIGTIDDLEGAISSGLRDGVDAFYISGEPIMFNNMPRVMPLLRATAKPTVASYIEFCRAGVLMTYATDILDGYRRAGIYAARILEGAKAGDLPIEQASKYTLAVNAKTAKLLGITIPPAVLALADEVVE
jgi:putative ABC transport system substrate-binding protein